MKKRLIPLLMAMALLLSACGAKEGQVSYETGSSGASVVIKGYDAQMLEYHPDSLAGGYLYFASPVFLGGAFEGVVTEGDARLEDGKITVAFMRKDDQGGTVFGAGARFTVDVESKTVTESVFTPWEGHEITMTEEDMAQAGLAQAELIRGARTYLNGTI